MKKKIRKLFSGFTVAELLMSMLVVMVIATAMVPIIGPKKIKITSPRKTHGMMQCYYDVDESGSRVLKEYYVNSRTNEVIDEVVPGDHCTFNVPVADHFEIYTIGAGSDGYRGEEVGYDINPQVEHQGNIRLSHFQDDIAATASYTNQVSGITEGSFANTIRNGFQAWAADRRNHGKDLYAAFRDVTAPSSAAGSSKSHDREVPDEPCPWECAHNTSQCTSMLSEHYSQSLNEEQRRAKAIAQGKCKYHVYANGGKPAPVRLMSSGGVALVPIGAGASDYLTVEFSNTRSAVYTMVGGRQASFELKPKGAGKNATGNTIEKLKDGADSNGSSPSDIVSNSNGMIRYGVNGNAPLSLNNHFVFNRFNGARSGSATFNDNAFTWSYTTLYANYAYGTRGEPGGFHVMVFNNLQGTLYLFPGTSNSLTGEAVETVVSKSSDRTETRGWLSHAESRATPGVPVHSPNTKLDLNVMPLPPQDVRDAATADNTQFGEYISKLRASGFRGGLFNCRDEGSCPGYAGSGAYPFIDVAVGANQLTLRDNQNIYNNGSFTVPYAVVLPAGQAMECPSGETLVQPFERNYTVDGVTHSYNIRYCIASNDRRRDGAVVIIW